MSFGFPRDSRQISYAISTVQRERDGNIIFLASAGNSSSDEESFPARHPDVLSVYATDDEGVFRSAPATTASGAAMLGTFGHDIPGKIREEFRDKYEQACQPGSSVATAVLAGISATMLLYAHALPSLVPLKDSSASTASQNILHHIHSTKGMEAVLLAMSKAGTYAGRHRAVNPIVFWKTHPTELSRSSAIFVALSAVDRKVDKSSPEKIWRVARSSEK